MLGVLCFGLPCLLLAQTKSRIPASVATLFDDLPIDDPASNSRLLPGEDSAQKISKNIFIRSAVNTARCYSGQPVLFTATLYSCLQSTSTLYRSPALAGFSVFAMETNNSQVKRQKLGEKTYRVFTILQLQLTPLQDGPMEIEPVLVNNTVAYTLDGRKQHYSGQVAGNPISLYVDPLPLAGRPALFSGAVGNFSVIATADTLLRAGDNGKLHIEITGTGNLNGIESPVIEWPAQIAHYGVTASSTFDRHTFPLAEKKIFDIPFVVKEAGTFHIPPIKFNFFDPQKKAYQEISALPITLVIAAGLQVKPSPLMVPTPPNRSYLFYLLGLLSLIAVVVTVLLIRKGNRSHRQELPTVGSPVTVEPVINWHDRIEDIRGIQQETVYVNSIKQVLTALLQTWLGGSTTTASALIEQVMIKDATLAHAANSLFKDCDQLLYAPGHLDGQGRAELQARLKLIANLILPDIQPKKTKDNL